MANPRRYQQFSVTAAAGAEETVAAIPSVSGIKQTIHAIMIQPTASIDLLFYEGQTKAIDMPSEHVPPQTYRVDIDVDVDSAVTTSVGIRNNTAGPVTQVITVEYDYGT